MTPKEKLDLLVDFLEWLHETSQHSPMQFETDNDDIAMMYLDHKKTEIEKL